MVVRHKTTPIDNFVPNDDWELILNSNVEFFHSDFVTFSFEPKKCWYKLQCHQNKKTHKKYPWGKTQFTLIVGHKIVTQKPCCRLLSKIVVKKGFRTTRGAKSFYYFIVFYNDATFFIEFLSPSRILYTFYWCTVVHVGTKSQIKNLFKKLLFNAFSTWIGSF